MDLWYVQEINKAPELLDRRLGRESRALATPRPRPITQVNVMSVVTGLAGT
jgi:hypothetical protein